jgi:hypothetical protein
MVKTLDCFPKHSKKVIIPTRKDICEVLEPLRVQLLNSVLPLEETIQLFGQWLGEHFRVNVRQAAAKEVDLDDININAYYDPELDYAKKAPIELILVHHPLADSFYIDDEFLQRVSIRIADSLIHEMIHMRQYRSRGWEHYYDYSVSDDSIESTQVYLADPDEIDAYSYNIAAELTSVAKLQHLKTLRIEDSINLWVYLQTFNKDTKHPVLKRLLKKVYKNLT